MATKGQIRFISDRIESLEHQRQKIHLVVDQYINQAVTAGQSWVDSNGLNGQNYQDVCLNISSAMTYTLEIEEMSAEDLDKQGDENEESESLSPEIMPSTTATSASTTLSPPSTSSLPNRVLKSSSFSSSLLSDHLLLKLQERVGIIESEMTNMSEIVDELEEIKTGMGEIKMKMKKSEEMNEKALTKLQRKVDMSSKEYNANRSKDGKWLQNLEDQIGGMSQDMHSLVVDVKAVTEKVDQSDKRLGKVEKRTESVEERIYDVEKEQEEEDTKLKTIEKRLETCEKKHEKVEELDDKIRRIEDERKGKGNERMNEVEKKVSKLEEERLPILEDRLLKVEEDRSKDLRDIGDIKSEVSSLSSRVRVVENKQENLQIPPILGFTAQAQGVHTLTQDTIVTDFTDVKINKGGHFSPSTGVFIAPVDGLYLTSLCVRQHGDGYRGLRIYHERVTSSQAGSGEKVEVCGTETDVDDGCSSSLGLVNMGKGDKLYVQVNYVGGSEQIWWPSNFSCVLIG